MTLIDVLLVCHDVCFTPFIYSCCGVWQNAASVSQLSRQLSTTSPFWFDQSLVSLSLTHTVPLSEAAQPSPSQTDGCRMDPEYVISSAADLIDERRETFQPGRNNQWFVFSFIWWISGALFLLGRPGCFFHWFTAFISLIHCNAALEKTFRNNAHMCCKKQKSTFVDSSSIFLCVFFVVIVVLC